MIFSLADKKKEQNQELIEHLEEALALAREGKIVDFVGAWVDNEQEFMTFSHYDRFISAVGLAEMLKMDVINSANED